MNLFRYIRDWGHSGSRAAFYGTISLTLGGIPGRGRSISQWAMHNWCAGSCDALGIMRDVTNGHLLHQTGQCVIVANHLSTADIIVLGSVIDTDYRWLAKAPLFKVPFTGWHLKFAGHVPVYRGEKRGRNAALAGRIHTVVEEGASLLFFPEGTRSDSGELTDFRIGAFMAAVREDLPILPIVLRGTGKLMAKNAPHTNPDADLNCGVKFLEPIHPTAGTEDEEDEKRRAEELRDAVWKAYRQDLYGPDAWPPGRGPNGTSDEPTGRSDKPE